MGVVVSTVKTTIIADEGLDTLLSFNHVKSYSFFILTEEVMFLSYRLFGWFVSRIPQKLFHFLQHFEMFFDILVRE